MTEQRDSLDIDWAAVAYIAVSTALGVAAGVFGHQLVHENSDAIVVVVTLFSILAGFIVAIATLIGDPSYLVSKGWRVHEMLRPTIMGKLSRQKYLFTLYLLTLGAVFASTLVKKRWPSLADVLDGVYLGMAVTSFLLSLRLPSTLQQIQQVRHDQAIAEKQGRDTSARP